MYDLSGAFTMQLQDGINYRICVTINRKTIMKEFNGINIGVIVVFKAFS